jgi:hypothetical protein
VFECTEESVKVLEIKDRWVLLLHNGKKQALWMRNTLSAAKKVDVAAKSNKTQEGASNNLKTAALIVSPQEKSASENTPSTSTTAKSENTFHFERVWVDEQLADFGQLLNDARVIPSKKDGQTYFMFQSQLFINTSFFYVLKHEICLSVFLAWYNPGIIQKLSEICQLFINPYSFKVKSILTLCSCGCRRSIF